MIATNPSILPDNKKNSNYEKRKEKGRLKQAKYRSSEKGRAKEKEYEQTAFRRYRKWYFNFNKRMEKKKQRLALLERNT